MKGAAGSNAVPAQLKYEEGKILSRLSTAVREQFLALDPAERRFILTVPEPERTAYQQMAPEEQTLFARLPARLRGTYLNLSSAERHFARAASEQDLQGFLSLRPEERQVQISPSPGAPAGRDRLTRCAAQAARLAHEVITALSPWTDDYASVVEAAGAAAFDALRSGQDLEEARATALRTVLALTRPKEALQAERSRHPVQTTAYRACPVLPKLVAAASGNADCSVDVAHRLVESLGAWAGRAAAEAVAPRPSRPAQSPSAAAGPRACRIVD